MNDLVETARKLAAASRKNYLNPYTYLEWPEPLNLDQWFMSPELISLYGTEIYDNLSQSEQKRLSFFECVNFFSLNIHGEKPLCQGLAKRLYSLESGKYSNYLHHFLDEENKHMIYFAGFCERYAGKIYRDRKLNFERSYAEGEEDFLFFVKVLIFEEIADAYNISMAADKRLEPTAAKINNVHHLEEARHLVFGRQMVEHLFAKYSPSWSEETVELLRSYLYSYIEATWKEYYNPDVYKDAGLSNPYELVSVAWNSQASFDRRELLSRSCYKLLAQLGLMAGERLND